jgi:hypothetical protein
VDGRFIPATDIGRLTVDRPIGNPVVSAIRGTAAIFGVPGSAEGDPLPKKMMSAEYPCCHVTQRSDHDCLTGNPFVNGRQVSVFSDVHQRVRTNLLNVAK